VAKLLALGAVFAALLLALILIVFDSPPQTPVPVTTSTPVSPAPPSTTLSAPAASLVPPTRLPPGHKPGKPGKPGNGDGNGDGDGD
jgi:hypothetical protein